MKFNIFTKPWMDLSLSELASLVKELGFNGVELPIREGYQVSPNNISSNLKIAKNILLDNGITIGSVASDIDEFIINTMGNNDINLLRVCLTIDMKLGYYKSEYNYKKLFDKLIQVLEDNNVKIGVQNHCDYCIGSAIGLMHLIEGYDKKHICAVYDPAHCALNGEPVDMGLDIVYSQMDLINFKSAYRRRINNLNELEAEWETNWTTSRNCGYSWDNLVKELKKRNYKGDVCLPAEYTQPKGTKQIMGDEVIPFIEYDIKYLKSLFKTR